MSEFSKGLKILKKYWYLPIIVFFFGVVFGAILATYSEDEQEPRVIVEIATPEPEEADPLAEKTTLPINPQQDPAIGVWFRDQKEEDCFEGIFSFGAEIGTSVRFQKFSNESGEMIDLIDFTVSEVTGSEAVVTIGDTPFQVLPDTVLAIDALDDDGQGVAWVTDIREGRIFFIEACGLTVGLTFDPPLEIPLDPELRPDGET